MGATTPDDAAQAEAERIFPDDLPLYRFDDLEPYVSGVRDSDIREHQQDAFARGAAWQRARIAAQFEPETVTTAAEQDALPVGSVVLDPRGHALEKRHVPPDGFGITVAWYPSGSPGYLRRAPLPATVLHRGGDR